MGELGVGSRGMGDFFFHEKIAEVIGETGAVVDSRQLDDSGVVNIDGMGLVVTVDGIHSRLSDFPFLAGFHVTRAALRDIYVMGAVPVAVISDIHLADDGDVSKILEHVAGISAVCEVMDVPYVSGSTLRIGGDMVIGDRMTGGVGAVGIGEISKMKLRKNVVVGDVIVMTEGAGGGTICTTALYNNMPEIVEETINVDFLRAAHTLLQSKLSQHVHSMTDVTNGGLRGDAEEISKVSGTKLVVFEEEARKLVNKKVIDMLDKLNIDYLGVSLDSLLLVLPEKYALSVIELFDDVGVRAGVVGRVEEGRGAVLVENGEEKDFTPRFRESAYTPIKKVVGELTPPDFDYMKEKVEIATKKAIEKKKRVVSKLK